MLLPKKVGSFTLMRKLDADGMTESYVGILDDPAGQQVVARRILPAVARDPGRLAQLRARIGDLRSARHPSLVPVLDLVEADGDLYILEEWNDGTELRAILDWCSATRTTLPHNVYLNLATQVCNALEALHSRPGTESGSENVLHLALSPSAMWVTAEGKVTVGRYGLARSPTAIATQATGSMNARVEYLAPEQTHQDQKLTPASDIFALGSILYELLTLKPMFKADSHLQTIHRVRRAEVTTQLLEVKEILQGLDKVLFRALSLNPRHRYQRAFVLREDLRGLMAGYTFADIDENTRAFLAPILKAGADGYIDSRDEDGHYEDGRDEAGRDGDGRDDEALDEPSGPLDGYRTDPTGGAESTAFLLGQGRDDDSDTGGAPTDSQPQLGDLDSDTDALLDSQTIPPYEPDRHLDEDATDRPEEDSEPLARPTPMPLSQLEPASSRKPGSLADEASFTPAQRTAWIENRPTLVPQDFEDDFGSAPSDGKLGGSPIESIDTGRPQRPDTGAFLRRAAPREAHGATPTGADAPEPGFGRRPLREPTTDFPSSGRPGVVDPDGQPTDPRNVENTDALLLDPSGVFDRGDTDVRQQVGLEPETLPTPDEPRDDTGPTPIAAAPPARAIAPAVAPAPVRPARPPKVDDSEEDWPDLAPIPKKDPRKSLQPPNALRSPDATPAPPPTSAAAAKAAAAVAAVAAAKARANPSPAQLRPTPASAPTEVDDEQRPASLMWMPALAAGVAALTLVLGLVCVGIGGGGVLGLMASTGGSPDLAAVEPVDERASRSQPSDPPAPLPVEPVPAPPTVASAPAPVESAPVEPVERVRAPVVPRSERPRPSPEPRERVAAVEAPAPQPRPTPRAPAPPPPAPARETWDGVAAIEEALPVEAGAAEEVPLAVSAAELDAWSTDAFSGQLGPDARSRLADVPAADPGYTRARTLLFLDAKGQGDARSRDQHLAAMMAVPENRYNPVLLVEEAQIAADAEDWERALARAAVAEQHWARLPSDLVYTRKALIYEIQAVAHTSLFYDSQGDDLDRLAFAIRGWERYRRHVVTKDRPDLVGRADQNLDRLYEIQRRLQ